MISLRRRMSFLDLSPLLGAFLVATLVAVSLGATGVRSRTGPSAPATPAPPQVATRSAIELTTSRAAAVLPRVPATEGRLPSRARAPLALGAYATPIVRIVALVLLGGLALLANRIVRHRRALALEVLRQRETLRVTLASIGDGVMTTDVAGRVLYLNGEAESLTGWTSGDAAGKPVERIFRIVNEETRLPVENPASRALADGVVVGLASHTVLIGKDGVERPIGDIAAPIRDERGAVVGVVLVFRDVTEERAATNQLRQLAAELSEADGRKNEFLAMLAHEIRSPLAAIRNSVAVLRLAHLDPRSSAAAQGAIHRQMEHLARLVEDLLDVSRISHGKLALRRAPLDLRPAIEQALEANAPLFASNEQNLEIEIADAPLPADADAARVTQAVGNLLNNAGKFTPRAGTIRLSAGIENGQVAIRVRDDGIGISPEHLSSLFDMFSQVDTSLERSQDGLGIGLHLVRQLVEMHGGTVEAKSDGLARGSEFVIRLPSPAPSEAALRSETLASSPAPLGDANARGTADIPHLAVLGMSPARRILVVDDNVDSADSLAMLLRLQGHVAEVAHDGLEAVEVALRTLPDVVLLDLGLPKLNGYETARRIRLSPQGRKIRLVALTGRGQDEDRRLSLEAGYDAHLVKPVDQDRLLALLAQPSTAQAPVAISR